MEGLIGLLFFLIALYLAYLLILLIVGLFLDIIKGIWDFIVGIVTEVWNFFTDPIVLIPMIILTIIVIALNIKQRKKWLKEEEDRSRRERQANYERQERARERREIQRIEFERREEERKRKAAETRRKNAEKKRKEEAARKEKERKEKAARKERERKEALARKKSDQIKTILDLCRADEMPSELINFLSGVLSNVSNPSHRDVLLNVWKPLGKPKGGRLEPYQSWMISQVSSYTNLNSIKSELNKIKKQIVNPLERDLSHLVSTAASSSRYGRLVTLWSKYQDMPRSDEAIKRIYNGENEDTVLVDLDLLQS